MTLSRITGVANTRKISENSGAPAAAAILAVFLILVYMMTDFLLDGHDSPKLNESYLVLILFFIGFYFIAEAVFNKKRGFTSCIFWYAVTFGLCWPGYVQTYSKNFPWPGFYTESLGDSTVFLIFLFMAFYKVGVWSRERKNKATDQEVLKWNGSIGFILMFLFVTSVALMGVAGSVVFAASRGEASSALEDKGVAYFIFAGKAIAFLGLATSIYVMKGRRKATGRVTSREWILVILFSLSAAVWYNPISNPRTQTIALAILLVLGVTRFPASWQKAGFVTALWLGNVFALGPLKAIAGGGSFSLLQINELRSYLFRVDFDSYEIVNCSIRYVVQNGYFYMSNIVSAALFWVPRTIWPTKPVGTSLLVTEALGFDYTNVSFPLPAEFYVAGGYPAVIIFSFLLGRTVTTLEVGARQTELGGGATYTAVAAALMTAYMPIIFRGALGAVLPFFGLTFIMLFGLYLIRGKTKKAQ